MIACTAIAVAAIVGRVQAQGPHIYTRSFGHTAIQPLADDYIEDLSGRLFDGPRNTDWIRAPIHTAPEAGHPFGGLNSAPKLYGWGVAKHGTNWAVRYPKYPESISPMAEGHVCVAGASVAADAMSLEYAYYMSQGVAATRIVYVVIPPRGARPTSIPINVTLAYSLAIGNDAQVNDGQSPLRSFGGGEFTLSSSASVGGHLNETWILGADVNHTRPFAGLDERLYFTTSGIIAGSTTNDLVGTHAAASIGIGGSAASRSFKVDRRLMLQPRPAARTGFPVPSSLTFTAQVRTSAATYLAAGFNGEARGGGRVHAAAGANVVYQLPNGYRLAIVGTPEPVRGITAQGPARLKAGSTLRLTANDSLDSNVGGNGGGVRLPDPSHNYWQYPLQSNHRTLFYLDKNRNGRIDRGDPLLGETINSETRTISVKVKAAWGRDFRVIAVFENALGERGATAARGFTVGR